MVPSATSPLLGNDSLAFILTSDGTGIAKFKPTAVDAEWDALHHHFTGIYLNFETDPRPERIADAFPPRTLQRLRELKARYDPDNVFRDNFNIAPGVLAR